MYIILGKNGYIAEAIIKELKSRDLPHVAWSRSEVNYTAQNDLWYNILKLNTDDVTIINCAGYIGKPNVDACELAKADCVEGNVVFPAMISQLCHDKGYDFVQISSGCIYGGYQKHFNETDPPNFDFQNGSFYSGTKALAEKLVLQNNPRSYIFRLRIPFDSHESPRNYITKILNYNQVLDVENSFSHRADFAKYCIELIQMNAPRGIYNVTNRGSATTSDVIDMIHKHLLPDKQFETFSNLDAFMAQVTTPRSNCVLDTSKLEELINIRDVHDALEQSIRNYVIN